MGGSSSFLFLLALSLSFIVALFVLSFYTNQAVGKTTGLFTYVRQAEAGLENASEFQSASPAPQTSLFPAVPDATLSAVIAAFAVFFAVMALRARAAG